MKFLCLFINLTLLRRNKQYRLLYIGQFISFFGTMITSVALPYQIYHLTHSTFYVGLLSFSQLMPLLITALIGGVFADRHHRKTLLLISESLLALGCLTLAYNSMLATPHTAVIFIAATFMAAMNGFHRPALESITQQLVNNEDFAIVSALSTFTYSVAMIGGPAIGGLLIAHFGIITTYLVDFSSFLISLAALYQIKNVSKPIASQMVEPILKSLRQGCVYALSRQELLGSYAIDFIAMIFGMPMALFPAIAEWYGGANALGLLYSAPAVGALTISLFSGWLARIQRQGASITIAALLWGVAIVGFGVSTSLSTSLLFLILAGLFDAVSGMFRQTLWNQTIPQDYRGRLAGIEMISYMSGPKLGDMEAGLIAAAFGISASVISGGILCIVGVAICARALPRFWRYRTPTTDHHPPEASIA